MTWLVSTSLRFRVLVLAAAIVLMVVGIRTADDLPLDVFPEFAPPLVEIQTEAPGLSTTEVESLVTVPIENSLNGIPYVQTVRSNSVEGLSSVRLIFKQGMDLLTARQLVQERLSLSASQLPAASRQPVILPPLSSLSRAMKIGLSSKTVSQMDMTVLSKWTIRPRLMAIEGVANVAIWGDYDRQFQVLVNPDRLRASNITLNTVVQSVRQSTVVGSGGFLDTPNQRIAIRHVSPIYNESDLESTVVAHRNNTPLLLGDVADVRIGSPPPIGDAIINDGPGIMLIVEKQPWANTLEVTRNVEAAMEALKPALGGVEVDTTIFRPATFIERALDNLSRSLLIGCLLVIVVLSLFLFDWRAALISCLAIPLSLTAAAMLLFYRGGTINTMVLAGLIIALGEVVDDAIIDVENILRRLKLNRESANPQSAFRVVFERIARSPQRRGVCHADCRVDAAPRVLSRRSRGLVLPAARGGLCVGDHGFARRGAHRDAGVVVDAPPQSGDAKARRPADAAAQRRISAGAAFTHVAARHRRRIDARGVRRGVFFGAHVG